MLSVTVRDTKIIEMWVPQNSSDSVHQFSGPMTIIPFNNEEDGVRETIQNRSSLYLSICYINTVERILILCCLYHSFSKTRINTENFVYSSVSSGFNKDRT